MSAIMGSLLVILGAFGFSVSLCLEYRMRLILLKQIRGVYEYGISDFLWEAADSGNLKKAFF